MYLRDMSAKGLADASCTGRSPVRAAPGAVCRLLTALVLLPMAAATVSAAESYDNCTGFVESLPATISTQGTWCFNQDLSTAMTTGAAITIAANNVTLDCNDFKLGGLAAGAGSGAIGIRASDRSNITLRHCKVRGFYVGAALAGGSGYLVEDNSFEGNIYIGVSVAGAGSVVRRNQVIDTGGSTVSGTAYGIATYQGVDVLDNIVDGVFALEGSDGGALGIFTNTSTGGRISGNRVRALVPDGLAGGGATAIYNSHSDRVTMDDNHVVGSGGSHLGLRCVDGNGRAKDNMIAGFQVHFGGCGDGGGNDFSP